jgi:hypothetical protein
MLLWSKKTGHEIFFFLSIKQKPVSLTSNKLVLDNASVRSSQCPFEKMSK